MAVDLKKTIFIYETDTVWGIGCSVGWKEGHQNVRMLKEREPRKPFSLLFPNFKLLKTWIDVPMLDPGFLSQFFEQQGTLLVPLTCCRHEIEKEVYCDSPYIGIRVLNYLPITSFVESLDEPITTTSLNLSGEPPIVSSEAANDFYRQALDKFEGDFTIQLVQNEKKQELSGLPSTVLLYEHGHFKVLRKGHKVSEILKLVKNYS